MFGILYLCTEEERQKVKQEALAGGKSKGEAEALGNAAAQRLHEAVDGAYRIAVDPLKIVAKLGEMLSK